VSINLLKYKDFIVHIVSNLGNVSYNESNFNFTGQFTMNCFVIMPFERDFDDVYMTIKQTVEAIITAPNGRCFRLDDSRPAGRITDRLLRELHSATFCIADLTGNNPNVMWELGFVMALNKPTIILTQNLQQLPFDIRDMQSIEYHRNRLAATLSNPLQQMIIHTASVLENEVSLNAQDNSNNQLVGILLQEVAQLKNIVAEAVRAWKPIDNSPNESFTTELSNLQGCWINLESGTHLYAKLINGELVVPYCYGANDSLSAVYFGWQKTGDYWFARFEWFRKPISGFAFLKQESIDTLTGTWWSGTPNEDVPNIPPEKSGIPARWKRKHNEKIPLWALEYFEKVSNNQL